MEDLKPATPTMHTRVVWWSFLPPDAELQKAAECGLFSKRTVRAGEGVHRGVRFRSWLGMPNVDKKNLFDRPCSICLRLSFFHRDQQLWCVNTASAGSQAKKGETECGSPADGLRRFA
ncbi:hypothetical protein GQ54DRAFT_13097 [Martensiomyces pterosporus]|nr:hypothetical protein GQ54DRAFT_13097 [Martensiomyces pterosporus]